MHRLQSPLLLIAVLMLPTVGADHWGVHSVTDDATLEPPEAVASFWVCLVQRPPGDEPVVGALPDGQEVRFAPLMGRPDCQGVTGPVTLDASTAEEVRALVLSRAPQEASTPGLVRLARAGVTYDLPRASSASEVGVLLEHSRSEVRLYRGADLLEVGALEGPGETRFRPSPETPWTGGVLVVLVAGGPEASALVDWEDPLWYRPVPTVGQIAVVVAMALFLMLYHGRSKRRFG